MANLNKVLLIGNLTRDPELRYVPSGTAVATLGLAVNSIYNTQQGEKKQETCFIRVVAWGRTAELCGEYLSKGSPIFIEGRLMYRAWDGANGEKRSTLEVRADRIQFLGRAQGAQQGAKAPASDASSDSIDMSEDIPLEEGSSKDSSKDEIPF